MSSKSLILLPDQTGGFNTNCTGTPLRPSHGGGLRALFFVENPEAFGHDTTEIATHCSTAIHASQGGGALAVALPPSHSDPRKARHEGEAAVPLPADGLHAHVGEEQIVGLAGGTALETADESAAF